MPYLTPMLAFCDNTGEFLAARLRRGNAGANTAAGAPRGASLYPQLSWEGLGGRFLGRLADLDPKGEGAKCMPANPVAGSSGQGRCAGGTRVIGRTRDRLWDASPMATEPP
jgi:hypothetical protein